jgi:hypothetical protein
MEASIRRILNTKWASFPELPRQRFWKGITEKKTSKFPNESGVDNCTPMALKMVIVLRIPSIEKSFLSLKSLPIYSMVASPADMRSPTSTTLRGSQVGDLWGR